MDCLRVGGGEFAIGCGDGGSAPVMSDDILFVSMQSCSERDVTWKRGCEC
jgi:hypothetical protein